MPRGKRAAANKQDLWNEISEQLNMPVDPSWYSTGSNVNAQAFEAALKKIGERTGIPPSFLNDTEQLVWRMLHKGQEAMIQCIQTVNNPAIIYRLETFLFLFINAWELLLKARIIKETGNLKEVEIEGDEDKSISFKKCLNKIFVHDNDLIKDNLIKLSELRNKVAHKTIPIFPESVTILAQAGIFNFEKSLNQWFNRSLNDKIPGGMVFLVSSLDPLNFSIDHAFLSKRLTKDVVEILKEWEGKVKHVIEASPESDLAKFAIPISVKAISVNNPSKADLLMSLDSSQIEKAIFVYKEKNLFDDYPLSYENMIKELKRRKSDIKINEVNRIIKEYKLKANNKYASYSFRNKGDKELYESTGKLKLSAASIYNYATVEFIVSKLNNQP